MYPALWTQPISALLSVWKTGIKRRNTTDLVWKRTILNILVIKFDNIFRTSLCTRSASSTFESCIIFGAALSNIVWVYHISLRLGEAMCFITDLTYGMFVGAMAMALSETIKVFPIMIRRLKLKIGITAMVTGFALGKAVGGIICYVYYIR